MTVRADILVNLEAALQLRAIVGADGPSNDQPGWGIVGVAASCAKAPCVKVPVASNRLAPTRASDPDASRLLHRRRRDCRFASALGTAALMLAGSGNGRSNKPTNGTTIRK